jgi:hypothetical protein
MLIFAQLFEEIFLPSLDLEGSSIQSVMPEPANALTCYYIPVDSNIIIALLPASLSPSMLHVPTISPSASLPPWQNLVKSSV